MSIYAYNGISSKTLTQTHTTTLGQSYTLQYNQHMVMPTRFKGQGKSTANAQGWERNSQRFFQQHSQQNPQMYSKENLMRIAQLRGVTRRLGISLLTLRPDGVHMRMDEKFLPDPALLFEAVTRADERLRFTVSKTPELVLAQPRMDAESALSTAIYVMTKVHDELAKLREESKAKNEE